MRLVVEGRVHEDVIGAGRRQALRREKRAPARRHRASRPGAVSQCRCGRCSPARAPRATGSISISVTSRCRHAREQREPRRADAGAEFDRMFAWLRGNRGGEQDRVVPEAVAALGCSRRSRPPSMASSVDRRRSGIGAQFVAEAGIFQDPTAHRAQCSSATSTRRGRMPSEPSIDAHVAVEHDMRNAAAIQQGFDRRDQHGIVGADDFAHDHCSGRGAAAAVRRPPCGRDRRAASSRGGRA